MIIHSFILGPLGTNCYVLAEKDLREAVVVDPGVDPAPVLEYLARFSYRTTHVLLTHLHADHTAGAAEVAAATGAPIFAADGDLALGGDPLLCGGLWGLPHVAPFPFTPLARGRLLMLGQPCLVIPVPGHSPGSVCFHFPAVAAVFTGDTLFKGDVGRTDYVLGDGELLLGSIRSRLLILPEETDVYPGHGDETTIGAEKAENQFFAEKKNS